MCIVILAVVTVRSAARFTVYIYMISLACQPTTRCIYRHALIFVFHNFSEADASFKCWIRTALCSTVTMR